MRYDGARNSSIAFSILSFNLFSSLRPCRSNTEASPPKTDATKTTGRASVACPVVLMRGMRSEGSGEERRGERAVERDEEGGEWGTGCPAGGTWGLRQLLGGLGDSAETASTELVVAGYSAEVPYLASYATVLTLYVEGTATRYSYISCTRPRQNIPSLCPLPSAPGTSCCNLENRM